MFDSGIGIFYWSTWINIMSSLIEQATKRLEQLRKVGIDLNAEESKVELNLKENFSHEKNKDSNLKEFIEKQPKLKIQSRLVELDLNALALAGIVSPNAPRSQIADQYRVINY